MGGVGGLGVGRWVQGSTHCKSLQVSRISEDMLASSFVDFMDFGLLGPGTPDEQLARLSKQ
jgi:hypothetical protein